MRLVQRWPAVIAAAGRVMQHCVTAETDTRLIVAGRDPRGGAEAERGRQLRGGTI